MATVRPVTWVVDLPAWVLVVGCVGFSLVVALASRWVIARVVPESEHEHIPSIAAPLMAALGGAFALLMGLTLASEAAGLRSAQDIVSTEATATSRLAWSATSPSVRTAPIQESLAAYLRATRADEWEGNGSTESADPASAAALADLERVVRQEAARAELGTPASTELLASVDAVSAARRSRLAAASRPLPAFYVLTIAASGFALLANAGALTLKQSRRTSLLLVGLATVVGLSMALLFALTAPWNGALTVTATPFDDVVRDLDAGFFQR